MISVRRLYLLLVPNGFFFAYWALSLLWYHVGLVVRPELSRAFYGYFGACWLLYFTGYVASGVLSTLPRSSPPARNWVFKGNILAVAAALSAIASVAMIFDVYRGGGSLLKTVRETEAVRSEVTSSAITTYVVPFYGLQLLAIASCVYWSAQRMRVYGVLAWSTLVIVLCRFLHSMLSANRQIFYFIICWVMLTLFTARVWYGYKMRTRVVIAVAVMMAISASYIGFIAVKRNDEGYLVSTTQGLEIRYNVSDRTRNSLIFAGALQLDDYPSHVFLAIDRIVENAPWVNLDVSPALAWVLNVKTKMFSPGGPGGLMPTYSSFMYSCGVYTYMWPSIFGDGAYCFGILGFPVVLFFVGLFFGRCFRRFLENGSFVAFYWFFLVYNYLIMGHMMIVGDAIMNVGVVAGIVITIQEFFMNSAAAPVLRKSLRNPVGRTSVKQQQEWHG